MMIAPAPTRTIVKQLKKAGFTAHAGRGSHEKFVCPSGQHSVSVPTGHSTISPGVRRQVDATIAACTCRRQAAGLYPLPKGMDK